MTHVFWLGLHSSLSRIESETVTFPAKTGTHPVLEELVTGLPKEADDCPVRDLEISVPAM